MKRFVLSVLLIVSAFCANAQSITSEACALGDQMFRAGDIKSAVKAYKKAIKDDDMNVKLLACFRLTELSYFRGGSVGAYDMAYCNAALKSCFKKMGSPVLTRDEFYTQHNISPLSRMNNNAPNENNQIASTSNGTSSKATPLKEEKKTVLSDVDFNIPESKAELANTFAIIIANENYQEVEDVAFAINDGSTFNEYCKKTLGIPETNISFVKNATANNMKREIRWLTQILDQYDGEAKAIVYYAGHGIPDEKTKDAYLLPVDGYGDDVSTGYSLNELYKTLNEVPSKSILVFLDACFSGSKRDGGMLASARGVAIKAKPTVPVGNMIVFSAAQGDETAYPYKDKGHGLFTYYLLKKMQETKGNVTLDELKEYVSEQVGKQSIIINRKPQTPNISVSSSIQDDWTKIKLK